MMLQQKITVIDSNSMLSCSDILLSLFRRCMTYACRTNSFFANTGLYPKASIKNLYQSIQRQSSNQIFLMLRPISDNGIRSIDIPAKSQRYRNLLESLAQKTLSLRLSRESLSQQLGQCKREKRLANISRFCTSSYQKSKAALRQRRFWHYLKKYSLRSGRNSYRSMSVTVSMGSASQSKECSQTAYPNRPERLYTYVCTHYKRCCARNNSFPGHTFRAVSNLRNGQRLHRFCNIIQFFKEQLLLRYQSKKECSLLSKVFSSNRQEHRFTKRPDNKTNWYKDFKTLPDTTEANHFSRRRTAKNFYFSDKQFSAGRINHLSTLQTSLEDRIILQMDQTELANKVVLRNFDQRCQDPGLDRDQYLRACSDNQKGAETGAFTTRNTPNYKYPTFRGNPAKTSTYGKLLYF